MKSCEAHAWEQVSPVVLKGTALPRLRAVLHESAEPCELASGKFEPARQIATRRNKNRGRGAHGYAAVFASASMVRRTRS
jgi:hypothetical protein